ncbi:hypothetical protein [uncultured Pantoea sp.]|uniref:hypothetical protein n=1 Tax=uncultured Pantoea sp. TaxID=218084 RepID=UPI00258587BB|nr:hypothetical protein [uncultured Pantoea sp.]
MQKNYQTTPKFVHNLWTTNEDGEHYLRFSGGLYEVEQGDAQDFLKYVVTAPAIIASLTLLKKPTFPLSALRRW